MWYFIILLIVGIVLALISPKRSKLAKGEYRFEKDKMEDRPAICGLCEFCIRIEENDEDESFCDYIEEAPKSVHIDEEGKRFYGYGENIPKKFIVNRYWPPPKWCPKLKKST